MKTPADKYQNDPEYRRLVETLESFIHRAQFTPSELREVAILAAVNYEMRQVRSAGNPNPRVMEALDMLDREFVHKGRGR